MIPLDAIAAAKRVLVALDYDGTLVPICDTPEQAIPGPRVQSVLRKLITARDVHMLVVSGRALDDLQRLLPIDGLTLIGGHGVAATGPLATATGVEVTLREALDGIRDQATAIARASGLRLEDKGTGLALHYRLAGDEDGRRAAEQMRRLGAPLEAFTVIDGKKVVEIRPRAADKGAALLGVLGASGPFDGVLFAGDDRTDEDAFAALEHVANAKIVTIHVADDESPGTRAQHILRSPEALVDTLERLAALR